MDLHKMQVSFGRMESEIKALLKEELPKSAFKR